MIDLHCHLLPGIDDGPPTTEAALALASALVANGITQVVMTPHVFPGRFENRRSSIEEKVAELLPLLQAQGLGLELMWAGEVRLTPEVLDLLAIDELPFLGKFEGYRVLLLEMPDGQVPLGALQFVRLLMRHQVRPLIAHPERNRGVMDRVERLQPLIEEGCLMQVTAGSLTGHFGQRAQAVAGDLLQRGWITAVASDAHNLEGRAPRMREAFAWLTTHHGEAVARQLTITGPASLCADNAQVNQIGAAAARHAKNGRQPTLKV